jgi:peptide/nickel transport system ATP-binding protein
MSLLRFGVRISSSDRTLVDVRDFQIPRDRITFLFGESGIGKSLTSRAIYGLLDPEEFNVTINGEPYPDHLLKPETKAIKENGFFVFQEPSTHLNPLLPLGVQLKEGDLSRSQDETRIIKEMWAGSDEEEIKQLLDVYPKPYRPSGGEKQRIFLVMSLKKIDQFFTSGHANNPSLFVFDEPTGSLDNHYRNVFLSLLFKRFQQHRFTALIITHDYSMVSEVVKTYHNLSQDVSFKELSLHGNRLQLSDFQPETYLGWLGQQQRETVAISTAERNRPLLRVESGATAFGQQLIISKPENTPSSLEILRGSLVYLKAPSGTGKTTLVKMMMGLIRGRNLRLSLDDITLTERTPRSHWRSKIWGKKMTMVFQHADEALNAHSTVMETFQGLPSEKRITREDVRRTLGELYDFAIGDEFMNKQVSTLSGGQKQRLNLLRSMFLDTDILILDEPLNGLDFESITRVLAKLREKLRAGKGILLISHNEEIFDALIPDEHIYYLHAQPA